MADEQLGTGVLQSLHRNSSYAGGFASFSGSRCGTGGQSVGEAGGGAVSGASGFKLVGMVVGIAAHSRVVSAGFGSYGAALSIYYHFLARGRDVVYPKDIPSTESTPRPEHRWQLPGCRKPSLTGIIRPSPRIQITARPTVTVMRLDHRPAIVDTVAGCVYKNQAARISKTGDHRRNDSGG
jgi:hypothetical protein